MCPASIFVGGIYAQPSQISHTLDTNETGASKNYVARDYISLLPGFEYKPSSGKSFSGQIEPLLLFPPTAGTYRYPDGTLSAEPTREESYIWLSGLFSRTIYGSVVGSIPGQFAVSPTGAGYTSRILKIKN